jgi:hypothetical protein
MGKGIFHRRTRLVAASLVIGFATFSLAVLSAQVASAAATCTFNGQPSLLTGVTPGEVITISCTGLPPKTSVFTPEASALAGLVQSSNQEDEADVGDLGGGKSNSAGVLATTFTVPSPFTAVDPQAACPPTQAQVNAGQEFCTISLATISAGSYGTVNIVYAGQPTPQPPTLALSPTSACVGQQVTITGGSGWWGNAGDVTPSSSIVISVGGVTSNAVTASISAASYSYSPPAPLVSPLLSGTFLIPSGVASGTQNVTVTEPNTTGLPGTVSASAPLTIDCNFPQTISFTSMPPSDAVFDGPTYLVSATASSDLPVMLSVDTSATSVCSLTGSTVSFIGVGTCTIDANQSGNDYYSPAPQVQQGFTVNPATPSTPTITNIPGSGVAIYGGSFVPVVSTTGDGTTSVTSSTSSVCTVTSGTVDYVGAGTCTLTAAVATGTDYTGADGIPQSFTVSPQPLAITSPKSIAANAGTVFSFTVTTSGRPVPSIKKKGKLPKFLAFADNHNGTALIAGVPVKSGVYHLKITATFGKGKTKHVMTQAFTLTVNPA